jgi:hypothetical protein
VTTRERLYLFDTTLRARSRAVGAGFATCSERRARANRKSRRACAKDNVHG